MAAHRRLTKRIKLRFLRRFPEFRELEHGEEGFLKIIGKFTREKAELRKKSESGANVIKSLNRYITALEGRDEERLGRISELERQCKEYHKTIKELRGGYKDTKN